jgi:hypothetical protein
MKKALPAIEDEESPAQDMVDIADTIEDQAEEPELQISLHALSGTFVLRHKYSPYLCSWEMSN